MNPTREEVERPTIDGLIDLIGELGRQAFYLLDDCETRGDIGDEEHVITTESLNALSEVLDRIDALPFEEPGCILGSGAMLQAALKQTLAAENAALRERLEAAEARSYALAVAIMGGEDAPGYADSVPTQVLVDQQRKMAAEWVHAVPADEARALSQNGGA